MKNRRQVYVLPLLLALTVAADRCPDKKKTTTNSPPPAANSANVATLDPAARATPLPDGSWGVKIRTPREGDKYWVFSVNRPGQTSMRSGTLVCVYCATNYAQRPDDPSTFTIAAGLTFTASFYLDNTNCKECPEEPLRSGRVYELR
jgi:hypothetical protein